VQNQPKSAIFSPSQPLTGNGAMSYGVESVQVHKKLRLDKRKGSNNWYARLTLPNGKPR
jgi:hypothetical protein